MLKFVNVNVQSRDGVAHTFENRISVKTCFSESYGTRTYKADEVLRYEFN